MPQILQMSHGVPMTQKRRDSLSRWQVRGIVRVSHQLNVSSEINGESTIVVMFKRYQDGKVTLQILNNDREETLRDPKFIR